MRGTTLVELIVAMTVLGLLTGGAALAVSSLHAPKTDARSRALLEARATALRSGRPVLLQETGQEAVLFLPDGRAIGRGLDPLTGEVLRAPR